MSKICYWIDRLINKPVKITGEFPDDLKAKDMCIYTDEDGKEMVATILWYDVKTQKKWTFKAQMTSADQETFAKHQEKAKELFVLFKNEFSEQFPESKPITARMNLRGNHIYFYFYAETRFNFSAFVKWFRQKIGMNFFLYQVWARDRVRLHPNLHEWYDPSWLPLTYHIFKHTLPEVDADALNVQQLWWRNNERLKDWSWKMDYTINFEKDFYAEEIKKYPSHWQILSLEWKRYKCTWHNLLTWEINLRWQGDEDKRDEWRRHGEFKKITLDVLENHATIEKRTDRRPKARPMAKRPSSSPSRPKARPITKKIGAPKSTSKIASTQKISPKTT